VALDGAVPVLPQRRDRVRRGLPGTHSQHQRRRASQRQLVHQHCGQLIEQVRIVHPDDHPGLSGPASNASAA
jgi:hypothetical protein